MFATSTLLDPWYPSATCKDKDGDGTVDAEYRWDWLENGPDLATEASVYGNSNGDRFYAVWNQELPIGVDENGEEIYTNMDLQFRRIFYNLGYVDTAPSAAILYISDSVVAHTRGGDLVLVGSGRDYDRLGDGEAINEVQWTSDLQGVLGSANVIKIPVTSLSLGTHTIVFKVKDNEENWSSDQVTKILVLEDLYQIHLPAIVR